MSLLHIHLVLEGLFLTVAGISDIRTREIDDIVWIAGAAVIGPLLLYELYEGLVNAALYVAAAGLGVVMAAALLYSGAMGEADAIEVAFISLLTPPAGFSVCVFPVISVFVDSLPFIAAYALYNVFLNYSRLRGRDAFRGYQVGLAEKLLAYIALRHVDRDEYRRKRYMYGPATVVENGVKKLRFTLTLEEGGDLEGGWVVVYLPQVALLAAGFIVYAFLVAAGMGGCMLDPVFSRAVRAGI